MIAELLMMGALAGANGVQAEPVLIAPYVPEPTTLEVPVLTPEEEAAPLWTWGEAMSELGYEPCSSEDDTSCYWDAQAMGNGAGRDFVTDSNGDPIYRTDNEGSE